MFIIQVNNDGILDDLIAVEVNREVAVKKFLDTCETYVSNWCDYTPSDIDNILDDGFIQFAGGQRCVMFIDASNVKTDDDLASEIRKEPPADMKIARWVQDGEIDSNQAVDVTTLLEECARNLDAACSWDMQGQILFKGEDGKWYTVTTESIVSEANPEWLMDTLKELGETS